MIADTTFLIDVMAGDLSALRIAKDAENRGEPIEVTAPSIFELYVGVSMTKKPLEERTKIISFISSMPSLSFEYESAISAGMIYGERLKSGNAMEVEDAMIAGIAKIKGESLLTRNTRHFSNIGGLRVESY